MILPRTHLPTRSQTGFSLLEAIVALTILAMVGSALIAWANSAIATEVRLREISHEEALREEMLVRLAGVNPMANPVGEAKLGECAWRWQATAVGEVRPNSAYPQGKGAFEMQMHRVVVSTAANTNTSCPQLTFEARMVGWRRSVPYLPF